MKSRILSLILLVACISGAMATDAHAAADKTSDGYESNKQERNFIAAGNKLYRDKRYAEAEVQYRKAIEANQASETAVFNLAASLIRQGGTNTPDAPNKTIQEAQQLAAYNLGNLAYNAEQYQPAIEHYKNALRRNPDNDKARQNLRLAQKKLQEQQNQDQNQDKDKDKDNEQQQDKQDQQQDKDKNENKDENQDNQNQQQPQQQQDQQQNKQQGGISDQNAEQILKAMENEEKATRARINAEKAKETKANRRQIAKPW